MTNTMRDNRVRSERDQLNERALRRGAVERDDEVSTGFVQRTTAGRRRTHRSVTASPNKSNVKSMQDSEKLRQKRVVESLV